MKETNSEDVLHVIREIMHFADMRSRRLLREIGLSSTQAGVLHALADGEAHNAGEIAKSLSLTGATISGVLDRLEQKGMLVRVRRQEDRRKVAVRILPKGLALLKEIPDRFQDHFLQKFEELSAADRTRIHQALQEVAGLFGEGVDAADMSMEAQEDPVEFRFPRVTLEPLS
ncbi:MAG: MarR family transcriptional regulator [Verrucomicrobia bacterium]|nr:MarR family transcriptional regulator [Verrucomicrobiota bacterium]MCH8511306.1 MarR family transcriptional regulator [Kiritimatiellia bacterium]